MIDEKITVTVEEEIKEVPLPTVFDNIKLKNIYLNIHKPAETDFICPVLELSDLELDRNDPYVDKEYCESFCMGQGCKNIKNCENYKNKKFGKNDVQG